jgi:hypothetical protein
MIKSKKRKNKIFGAFNVCLIFMVIVGGFYFLKSMDDLMIKKLELENLNNKLELLKEEKQSMEAKKNILESYDNISHRIDDLGMVRVSSVDYISIGDDSLARR